MIKDPAEIWLSRIERHIRREQDSSLRADPNEGQLRVNNHVNFWEDEFNGAHRIMVRNTISM